MFNEVTILNKATWRCFRSAKMSQYWSPMWHDRRTGSSMHFSCSFIGIITVRRVPKTTKILFNKFSRMKFIAWKGEDKKEALVRLPWAKSIIIQNNAPMLIKLDNDTTNIGEKGRAANSSRCGQRSPPPWRKALILPYLMDIRLLSILIVSNKEKFEFGSIHAYKICNRIHVCFDLRNSIQDGYIHILELCINFKSLHSCSNIHNWEFT